MSETSSILQTQGTGKALTRRQKESLQLLLRALTNFVLEDQYDVESISDSDFDYEEIIDKNRAKKTPAQRFDEIGMEPRHALIPPGPPDKQVKENLMNACNSLLRESVTFEYSLRTLGSGGPGMFGAWVLRQSLRVFTEVVENCNMDELYRSPEVSGLAERHVLGCFIDELPGPLYDLWKAFDELECFLLDFVSFFHSIDLTRVLHSLKTSLKTQHVILLNHKAKMRISVAQGQDLRSGLLSFFSELEKSFQICSAELTDFRRQGVPLIRTSQSGQSDRYLMLTTISTFFSAVTSATLQIAFQGSPIPEIAILGTAVDTFFFSSLIFSTASAVQALLAMAWMRSFIRVPEENMIYNWVSKGPLFSLVVSGVFFAAGLCLFIIASQKSSLTTFVSVGFALIHAVGLVAMSIWFVHEQWKFRNEAGAIGRKLTETSVAVSLLVWVAKVWHSRFRLPSSRAAQSCIRVLKLRGNRRGIEVDHDIEHGGTNFNMSGSRPRPEAEPEGNGSATSKSSSGEDASSPRQVSAVSSIASYELSYHTQQGQRPTQGDQITEAGISFIGGDLESIGQVHAHASMDPTDSLRETYEMRGGIDNNDGVSELNPESEQDTFVVTIEPPSRSESVDSLPGSELLTAERVQHALHSIQGEEGNQGAVLHGESVLHTAGEPEYMEWVLQDDEGSPRAGLGPYLVDESLPLPSNNSFAQPGSSSGLQATPLSESDLLSVRRESWQQDLRQESMSYTEMFNRRNPKRKRGYPPYDSNDLT